MKHLNIFINEKLYIRKSKETDNEFEIGDTIYRLKRYNVRGVGPMYKPMPGIIENIKMVTIIQVDKTKRIEPQYKIKNIQGWYSIVFATEEEAIQYCNDKKLKIRK